MTHVFPHSKENIKNMFFDNNCKCNWTFFNIMVNIMWCENLLENS
jgi:hypothetical protein